MGLRRLSGHALKAMVFELRLRGPEPRVIFLEESQESYAFQILLRFLQATLQPHSRNKKYAVFKCLPGEFGFVFYEIKSYLNTKLNCEFRMLEKI